MAAHTTNIVGDHDTHPLPLSWDISKGTIDFNGNNAALFRTDSSLQFLFVPLVRELGIEFFRLLVADTSSGRTQASYQRTFLGNTKEEFSLGFEKWANVLRSAGWGNAKLIEYEPDDCHAVIQVDNPWELPMQRDLAFEERWGCPFLLGRVLGIFKNAFNHNCWATDHYEYFDNDESRVRITIYPSDKTVSDELEKLKQEKRSKHEQLLEEEIRRKTAALQKSNNVLKNIAHVDFLTNLHNRRAFEKALLDIKTNNEWNHYTLLFVDLDQFKIINDTCGHLAGDRLLTMIGERLSSCVDREVHSLFRYGGDEFTILLNNVDNQSATMLAEMIKNIISRIQFEWDDKIYQVNCSIGLIPLKTIPPEVDNAIIAADDACYQAKKNGRNQIFVSETINEVIENRLSEMNWVHKIREAISHNHLELHFQIIQPLNNKAQFALEALVRMIDDDQSLIMPNEFLSVAEHYNAIFDLDCWVIEEAFRKLNSLPKGYNLLESVAINLSGNTLSNPKLDMFIDACFKRYGIKPNKVCFEVTETHMMVNFDMAKALLSKLRAKGCTVSLDDFGAGMSSFGYLRELPIDKIKIDGSFVKNMHNSMVDYTFVESITNVAKAMGIKTVAEFVENKRIVELLRDISVDYAQGYYIGRPQTWDSLFPKK